MQPIYRDYSMNLHNRQTGTVNNWDSAVKRMTVPVRAKGEKPVTRYHSTNEKGSN